MSKTISSPPHTVMEVYKMLPEGTLAELIDGKIYRSPSPVTDHQRIISRLLSKIFIYVEEKGLGDVFVAPFDVYLDEHANAVQPDLIFVSKANAHIIKDHIHGVPDLLIELLSPGNKSHDTVTKKNLYEKFAVQEYWIIDPSSKEAIGYQLVNSHYVEIEKSTGYISSIVLNHRFDF
jgi:Uma2 family endonuclease